MKAMILAAGRGERMRPLTDVVPKPLLEIRGRPMIDWHLQKLNAAGFSEVVINVCHLAEKIVAHVGDGSRFGLRVQYSHEHEALESGGGVGQAAPLLGSGAFALISADIFSDFDYTLLNTCGADLQKKSAHLWLISPNEHQPGREFSLEQHRVEIRDKNSLTWSSIAVLHASLLEKMPRGQKFKLMPYFQQWIAECRISGALYSGAWENVTSVSDIARLNASA